MDSATVLTAAFQRSQYGECAEGKLLTCALLEAMQYELPGNLLDALPAFFLQHFMGAGNAALLGVDGGGDALLSASVALFGKLLTDVNRDECSAGAAEKVSNLLINYNRAGSSWRHTPVLRHSRSTEAAT